MVDFSYLNLYVHTAFFVHIFVVQKLSFLAVM